MRRLLIGLIALLGAALLTGCASTIPPQPEPVKEVITICPRPGAVWRHGHYRWARYQHRYVWVPGHWRVKRGRTWVIVR
jgi:hypothetical protein